MTVVSERVTNFRMSTVALDKTPLLIGRFVPRTRPVVLRSRALVLVRRYRLSILPLTSYTKMDGRPWLCRIRLAKLPLRYLLKHRVQLHGDPCPCYTLKVLLRISNLTWL